MNCSISIYQHYRSRLEFPKARHPRDWPKHNMDDSFYHEELDLDSFSFNLSCQY